MIPHLQAQQDVIEHLINLLERVKITKNIKFLWKILEFCITSPVISEQGEEDYKLQSDWGMVPSKRKKNVEILTFMSRLPFTFKKC